MTRTVLVTGATGYIGGRLLDARHAVHPLARNPSRLEGVAWASIARAAAGGAT